MFRLERPPSSEELEELVGDVVGWFRQHPDYADLRRLFTELVRQAFYRIGYDGTHTGGFAGDENQSRESG